jgi:D-apionolactonase
MESLCCGEIELRLDPSDGQLRYLKLGNVELLRGIYAAVRDQNWDTVPVTLSDLKLTRRKSVMEIQFKARHEADGIDFGWKGRISIDANAGSLVYELSGQAYTNFRRNRIGFVVLHAAELSGRKLEIESCDGTLVAGKFPVAISPHQPFKQMRVIRHQPVTGLTVSVRMEGDIFEMEDQRNWTDASYKTYCTPLELPFPVEVKAGQRVEQRIEVTWKQHALTTSEFNPRRTLSVPVLSAVGSPAWQRLPRIGFGASRAGQASPDLNPQAAWRSLRATHLRVDLRGDDAELDQRLKVAKAEMQVLATGLEVAVFGGERDPAADFNRAAAALKRAELTSHVRRWLVFSDRAKTTQGEEWRAARAVLGDLSPEAEWGAGTDAYFAELNRAEAPPEEADIVTFSVNPQVHAFDDYSLLETLAIQAVVVRDAGRIAAGRPIVVSPVTLRPRFNPNATAPGSAQSGDEPENDPAAQDGRQCTGLAAVWTLGSIGQLLVGGATAVTYFRLSGPGGLAADGQWFPVGNLFQAVGAFQGGEGRWLTCSDSPELFGLHLAHLGRHRMLVANASTEPVRLPGLPGVPSELRGTVVASDSERLGSAIQAVLPPRSIVGWDWEELSIR